MGGGGDTTRLPPGKSTSTRRSPLKAHRGALALSSVTTRGCSLRGRERFARGPVAGPGGCADGANRSDESGAGGLGEVGVGVVTGCAPGDQRERGVSRDGRRATS